MRTILGGFYKVLTGEAGQIYLELLAEAPSVTNNDGAMDTRGLDPFLGIDSSSTVLLKEPIVSIALTEDDQAALSAKGGSKTIDILANDTVSEGETLSVTKINGQTATVGLEVTLENGEIVSFDGNGLLTLTPTDDASNVSASLTYTIENDNGVEDTATVTVFISPIDGTSGNDSMMSGYTDGEGNHVEGSDGLNDVILGYGGNDKIFLRLGG